MLAERPHLQTSRPGSADGPSLVGRTPIQYLTQWRMLLAANLLRSSNWSLARVAEEVGYQTDTAFSRAFRREVRRAAGGLAKVAREGRFTRGVVRYERPGHPYNRAVSHAADMVVAMSGIWLANLSSMRVEY